MRKLHQVANAFCEFGFRGYGSTEPQQALDFLEVCAGSHRITSAAAEFGLRATALDDTWLDFHLKNDTFTPGFCMGIILRVDICPVGLFHS